MPGVGFVDHIVVIERGGVNQLDGHGALDQARIGRVAEVTCQQDEHGAEPLSAGRDQVRGRFSEKIGVGKNGLLERNLDVVQARPYLRFQRGVGGLQPWDDSAAHRGDSIRRRGRLTI